MTRLYLLVWPIFAIFHLPLYTLAATRIHTAPSIHAISKSRYSRAHSLGDNYIFDQRDGWETTNATNLQYKYPPSERFSNDTLINQVEKRSPDSDLGIGEAIGGVVSKIWNGLKGIGSSKTVTITWYTGHDLMYPSCWTQGKWAPTDKSFACATTLHGWHDRPQCFQFIELCNGPKKCVFVRVVDSCAGCKPGSQHVDLTRAAFSELADLDQGILSVQLRRATQPADWHEDLWGPRHKH